MMTGDEVLNLMEEYIKITDMISDILNGDLEVALVDGKGRIINLEDVLPDHKIGKAITSDLTYYKQDLRKQIKENI